MQKQYWKATCGISRTDAIRQIEDIINVYGILLNFQKFSDLDLGIIIEVEASRVEVLLNALRSVMKVEGYVPVADSPDENLLIFMNISFLKGTGNLTVPLPEVPG